MLLDKVKISRWEDIQPTLCRILGSRYDVKLRGYYSWEKYIMTFIRLKQIHINFHPEAGTYFCRDKCHHMSYFICMLNDKYKRIFFLGEHGGFGVEGILMRIQYCPVRM